MSDTFGGRGPVNNNLWTIETVRVDSAIPFWSSKVVGIGDVGVPENVLSSQPKFTSIWKEAAIRKAKDWIDEVVGAGKYAPEKNKPEVRDLPQLPALPGSRSRAEERLAPAPRPVQETAIFFRGTIWTRRTARLGVRALVRAYLELDEAFAKVLSPFIGPAPPAPFLRRLRSWSHDPR